MIMMIMMIIMMIMIMIIIRSPHIVMVPRFG